MVVQRDAPSSPKEVLKHVRIDVRDGLVSVAVLNEHGAWIDCAKPFFATERRITVFAGSLRRPLASVILRNLQKILFSLRHVQPSCTEGRGCTHQMERIKVG